MKVPDVEGLAIHNGPESCASVGNCVREALTGEAAGWVLSREIDAPRKRVLRGADVLGDDGRRHLARRYREARRVPARSETPSMPGSNSHGNREIPRSSAEQLATDRIGNPKGSRR